MWKCEPLICFFSLLCHSINEVLVEWSTSRTTTKCHWLHDLAHGACNAIQTELKKWQTLVYHDTPGPEAAILDWYGHSLMSVCEAPRHYKLGGFWSMLPQENFWKLGTLISLHQCSGHYRLLSNIPYSSPSNAYLYLYQCCIVCMLFCCIDHKIVGVKWLLILPAVCMWTKRRKCKTYFRHLEYVDVWKVPFPYMHCIHISNTRSLNQSILWHSSTMH